MLALNWVHHRILIVPITDEGRVLGVITRSDFFRARSRPGSSVEGGTDEPP